MLNFKIVNQTNIDWNAIEGCYDHNIYKSHEWMAFLVETKRIAPFVLEVYEKDVLIGYFIGGKFKRFFTIIASPFEGWSTPFQGLSMLKNITIKKRLSIYHELIDYLFKNNVCSLFQVTDMELELPYVAISDYQFNFELSKGYMLDLTLSEEELYRNLSLTSARGPINKSKRAGIIVQMPKDINEYVDTYYMQLCDVFEKQGLKPTHDENFAESILRHLSQSNKIIMLESITEQGEKAASGFFGIDGKKAFYMGGASFRKFQPQCPNEPLIWAAIVKLKSLGAELLEFGGPRSYKEKYGPIPYAKPKIIASRYPFLIIGKNKAKSLYYGTRRFIAILKKIFKPNFRN